MRLARTFTFVFALLLPAFQLVAPAAAAPTISSLSMHGLQAGGTTTLVVSGTDLFPEPRVLLGVPITSQQVKENAAPNRVEIEVTLPKEIAPGLYNLWLANPSGISDPVVVAIDGLPQLAAVPEKIESLPVALHGQLTGSSIVSTSFAGKAGQTVQIELEAARMGSKLRGVVHLYNSDRVQLAWAWPLPALRGDTRLVERLPADGDYFIEVHDLLYAGGAPGHFRLKIGSWHYADLVFPPAVEAGKPASLELIGNLPGAQRVELAGALVEATAARSVAAPWPQDAAASGTRPPVLVSDITEVVETPKKGDALQQLPSAPVAVSGRLAAPREEDRYQVAVAPGTKLQFEVRAQRLGAPLDTLLQLLNEKGGVLATNDDLPDSTDSALDYTVPADMVSLVVSIKDMHGRGSPSSIYRIAITPAETDAAGAMPPDFQLKVESETCNVPQQSFGVVRVLADRQGYDGPIQLAVENLPKGAKFEGAEIAAGASGTLLVVRGLGESPAQWVTAIVGTATQATPPIVRKAVFADHPLASIQPWLQTELGLAVTPPGEFPLGAEWKGLPDDARLVLGGNLSVGVKLTRPVADGGPVRVTLVSSQNAPRQGNSPNPDPNQTLRTEAVNIELAVDPQAKATADALAAAEKALAEAQTKAQQVTAAVTKTRADAAAKVKEAEARQAEAAKAVQADKPASEGDAAAKAAQQAKAAADKALADAQAASKAAIDATRPMLDQATAAVNDAAAKKEAAAQAAVASQAAAKYEADYPLFIPTGLPEQRYQVSFRLELLTANKQRVLATAYTPPRRLETLNPIELAVASPVFEVKLDAKAPTPLKIAGSVARRGGFAGEVTVTLEGLPPGINVPKVVVPADKDAFELEVQIPASFQPAALETVKVQGTCVPNPKRANQVVRSKPVDLSITVLAADKDGS